MPHCTSPVSLKGWEDLATWWWKTQSRTQLHLLAASFNQRVQRPNKWLVPGALSQCTHCFRASLFCFKLFLSLHVSVHCQFWFIFSQNIFQTSAMPSLDCAGCVLYAHTCMRAHVPYIVIVHQECVKKQKALLRNECLTAVTTWKKTLCQSFSLEEIKNFIQGIHGEHVLTRKADLVSSVSLQ